MDTGRVIMQDLKKALKSVLSEAVKQNGRPLDDSVSAITRVATSLEGALNHGLKLRKSRFASWRSSKASTSFFNLLEDLEQRLPFDPISAGGSFWGSVGLQPVRDLKWVKSSSWKLKIWLRQSLNTGLLAERLKLVTRHPEVLHRWYEAHGILQHEDTVDEFISIVIALNAVKINLSLDKGIAVAFEFNTKLDKEIVDTVPDMLSPIESPCSSPDHRGADFGDMIRGWTVEGSQTVTSQGLDVSARANDEAGLDMTHGRSDDQLCLCERTPNVEGTSACFSMFGVDGEDCEASNLGGEYYLQRPRRHQCSIQGLQDDIGFGINDWDEYVLDNVPGLDNFDEVFHILNGDNDLSKDIDNPVDDGVHLPVSKERETNAGALGWIRAVGRPQVEEDEDEGIQGGSSSKQLDELKRKGGLFDDNLIIREACRDVGHLSAAGINLEAPSEGYNHTTELQNKSGNLMMARVFGPIQGNISRDIENVCEHGVVVDYILLEKLQVEISADGIGKTLNAKMTSSEDAGNLLKKRIHTEEFKEELPDAMVVQDKVGNADPVEDVGLIQASRSELHEDEDNGENLHEKTYVETVLDMEEVLLGSGGQTRLHDFHH